MSDGRTTSEEFERLVRRILTTQDHEIDCEQVADLVARYVELEVAGEGAPQVLPQVYHHLVQCDACGEIRAVLFQLLVLEEDGTLPDSEDLLDEIVASDDSLSDRLDRTAIGSLARPDHDRVEGHPARRPAPPSERRPRSIEGPMVSDRGLGEARWVRWAILVLVLVFTVLLGLWLVQNGGPLSKLNESMALAAVVWAGTHLGNHCPH